MNGGFEACGCPTVSMNSRFLCVPRLDSIQGILLTAAQIWKFGDPTNEIVSISFKAFSRVKFFRNYASRAYV